jgi:hypothetical protein
MPGVYFTAESSRLAHLAAKLEEVVGRALAMSQAQRKSEIEVRGRAALLLRPCAPAPTF